MKINGLFVATGKFQKIFWINKEVTPKFLCFLYEWDSKNNLFNRNKKYWPKRMLILGIANVLKSNLIKHEKIFFSTFLFKTGNF